jgi:hypothetical protein
MSKDHSELMITHQEGLVGDANAVRYNLDVFGKILAEVREEGESQVMMNGGMEDLDNILRKILEEVKNALNIGFEMHEKLCSMGGLLVKTFVGILSETNLRVFTLIVPHYNVFAEMVNYLLVECQPK